jgi:hypothetical protein
MVQAHLLKEWCISFCNTFGAEKPNREGVCMYGQYRNVGVVFCSQNMNLYKKERHLKSSRVNKNVYTEIMVIFLRDQDRLLLPVNMFSRLSHLRWSIYLIGFYITKTSCIYWNHFTLW